jgi:hypothetical protein
MNEYAMHEDQLPWRPAIESFYVFAISAGTSTPITIIITL